MINYREDSDLRGTPRAVISQVQKAVVGKFDIIEQIMMAFLAKGHILVEDIPGTGKTTMALAFSHAMGLKANRVQFTPDVLPACLPGSLVDFFLNQFCCLLLLLASAYPDEAQFFHQIH